VAPSADLSGNYAVAARIVRGQTTIAFEAMK